MAVITGGSRGIGLAIAERLAREGFSLAICGREPRALISAERQLQKMTQAMASRCDVSDPKAVSQFFAQIQRRFRKVDVLVNNAGLSHPTQPVEQLSIEHWRRNLDVNLTGTFLCTRAALPLMSAGGTIVNNLSVAIRVPFPGTSAYAASKAGVLGFTNVLRAELRERGIRVVALIPGPVATDLWDQFWPDAPREKMVTPETVAEIVAGVVLLPRGTTVEELAIGPVEGTL